MAKAKPALGRGLSALLDAMGPDSAAPVPSGAQRTVAVARISANPAQPRRDFDPEALAELTESVRAKGVLVPLLLRPAGDGFELIAGERRWRAAQAAGLHEVPAVVREMSDAELFEAALIENVQRADLNPAEEAQGYRRLMDEFGHRQEDVSRLTGKSRSHVANLLRVLDLPDEVLDLLRQGRLSMGHAKVLMGAPDPAAAARAVTGGGLSVRATEEMLKKPAGGGGGARARTPAAKDADVAALEDAMEAATGLAVTVTTGPGAGGEVRIRYSTLEQLDGVVSRLTA